ncbi:ran guanine nucleotide release factor [Cyclospora cayetanensis]|nr:ran guanine nucleotide release factor [Cyclospora cayetanensis]
MACNVPDSFDDLSKIMVVPDQQEALTSECGRVSVIIEVLEYQAVPDAKAAEFFFNDLTQANSALSSKCLETKILSPSDLPSLGHTVGLLKGEFAVQKKAETTPEHVFVRLAVIRIPKHRADILISMNEKADDTSGRGGSTEIGAPSFDDTFRVMIETFKINDYGLFA